MSATDQDEDLVSLLPPCEAPTHLYLSDTISNAGSTIEKQPVSRLLTALNRDYWTEGLYVKKQDLPRILRYKNSDGSDRQDFGAAEFRGWVETIVSTTAICDLAQQNLGKGVFVLPGKTLPKGTFIASTGIIKLDPTQADLETKVHCSALQNLNTPEKTIYGIIDPDKQGGILDLINHAPTKNELSYFHFLKPLVRDQVALANLQGKIRYYQGFAIMGVEAMHDIHGGERGAQLLWSYALPDEYIACDELGFDGKILFLFNNSQERLAQVLNPQDYTLQKVTVYFDTGELLFRKVACLTRWEIMERPTSTRLVISAEDPYSTMRSETIQSPITYGILQEYLKINPDADRIIIKIPPQNASRTVKIPTQ